MPRLLILVPGGSGQLGRDLAALADDQVRVRAPGSAELNLVEAAAVTAAVDDLAVAADRAGARPVVINAAAYTAVDAAETDPDRAFAVNVTGARHLARACAARDVPLVHVSTDYVFDGSGTRPYEPDDTRRPMSVYGHTKAAGEDEVLAAGERTWIVRTAWLYGAGGSNFVATMIRLERERDIVRVVDDQRGSPTWTADLAGGLLELGQRVADGNGPPERVLHCTNAGDTTWYGFTRAIFAEIGADPQRVQPCSTAEFPRPASRPAYSVLSDAAWVRARLAPLRPWREALRAYFTRSPR